MTTRDLPPQAHRPSGLHALTERLRADLALLELPPRAWMPEIRVNGRDMLDVVIIGGGMAGLAAAASLRFLGIEATVYDRAPRGYEGPWATTARMETLRSPKGLVGPALELPSLTFRAWFEAQFGAEAWEALDKIPRLQWMDYLRWYRRALGLVVHNGHDVRAIQPRADGCVELQVSSAGSTTSVLARRVVLATGRDGLGGPYVPRFAAGLPRERWAHSSDDLDGAAFANLRVGVVGAGASAMDSAATALEGGAASVDLLIRRADIPRVNKGKGAGNPGMNVGFVDLPDDWKWRIRHYLNLQQTPPPRNSTLRVSRHANARFHLGCSIDGAHWAGDAISVTTSKGSFEFDFMILSTGFRVDWHARPEFAAIAPHVRAWRDRYTPPEGDDDAELADSPDLGRAFELAERIPGTCPGLDRIHCFCFPATLSHGPVSGDIPAISAGAIRLAQGIASLFYREDIETHYARMLAYSEPEVFGDEWVAAEPPKT